MITHLVFDTTDAQTILDSSNVGAYVRAADGTLITNTTYGAVEALDVSISNASIVVTATDLDIRDLTQTDEVTVFQGTSPWVVSATDLDIRDLTAATDSVSSWTKDGTGTAITSTVVGADTGLDVNVIGGVNVEVDLSHVDDSVRLGDGTNFLTSTTVGADIGLDVNLINASIVVTATDLDIRDLTAASDSVQAWAFDGAGTALTSTLVGADQALDVNIVNSLTVNDAALANTAIANAANLMSVANTAEDVVASPLANRKYLFIQNVGNLKAYIGASGVSAANGYPISPGSEIMLRAGAAVDIEWVAANTSQEIRTLELA